MKSSRMLSLLLALVLALSLSSFVMAGSPALTDMAGREIVLSNQVERLVALQAADVEILYAIGAGGLLVGRGEYANYPEQALEVPSVQSGFETNFEQIIALEPDVVVLAKMGQREEDVKKLEDAGIITVVSDAQDIEGVYTAIHMLGQVTGQVEEAWALVESMRASFDEIKGMAEGKAGGSVYFEVSPLQFGLWTAGAHTYMDELANLLGLTNIFSDLEGWQAVSEEQVLARDPDYIVTTAMYFGEGLEPVAEILARPNWGGLKAVSGQKVFNADSDAITRPGPRLVEAARAFYSFVYGE